MKLLRLNVAEGGIHYILLQRLKVHLPSNPVHINSDYTEKDKHTWETVKRLFIMYYYWLEL